MNTQPRHPKCRALPVELHPDIHFSAIIPRRGRKSKIFLSVVIPVVKAAFMPLSATGGNPANTGVARLCGVSPYPVPDTATALPKQARYQLRYTRLFCYFIRLVVFSPKTSALPIGPLPDACRALYTIREEKATRKYVSTNLKEKCEMQNHRNARIALTGFSKWSIVNLPV